MAESDSGGPRGRTSASDHLTREILELVKQDELVPGDRLPTVSALAERFEVAPPTAREALRRLEALGYVDIRHGSGVYVRQTAARVIVSNPYTGRLEEETIRDLLDARLLIEPHLAGLAVARASDTEIDEIDDVLQAAEASLAGGEETLNEHNLDFHRVIARLSGNAVLAQTMDSLLDLYSAEQIVIQRLYGDREQDHREHRSILAAICDRRPDLASKRMQRHLEGVRTVLDQRFESTPVKSLKRKRS